LFGFFKWDSIFFVYSVAKNGYVPSPNAIFVAIAACERFSLSIFKPCEYMLEGDLNYDCKVNFYDFAKMVSNWLINCFIDPENPACVPKE
jgi:hypothetical protein